MTQADVMYKCALCGATFGQTIIKTDRNVLEAKMVSYAYNTMDSDIEPKVFHFCNRNDIGIADFIGLKHIK